MWTTSPPSNGSSDDDQVASKADSPGLLQRIFGRVAHLIFNARTMGRKKTQELPTHHPHLNAWPPLHIEKRNQQCCKHCLTRQKKRKRERIILVVLIVLLLYLLGNVIALNTRTFGTQTTPAATISTSSSSVTLSAGQQLCLSEYTINAPVNATSYPCSTCFPVLQSVSPVFASSNPQDAQQIANTLQFCALHTMFNAMNTEGQSNLTMGGWMQNVLFCSWTGVQCDANGRVSSLQLIFPGVPAALPSEIDGLTGLQTLEVIGNAEVPGGTLPASFSNLTALSTLQLQSTAISALPDTLFSSSRNITTLTLVKNAQMASTLPSSLMDSTLQNLIITNQPLNNPLSALAASPTLCPSLKLIDLSSTDLTGTIPSTISSLSSLVELHLDINNLTNPLPSTFPPKLEVLTLANNTGLSGPVSGSFCVLSGLRECDVVGTKLQAAGSCGACQFS